MTGPLFVRRYVVTCGCGMMALNLHRSYADACHAAQAHKDLNPALCSPRIMADDVPVGLG